MSPRAVSEPPRLRGFEFVKPLGSGGFSDVYLYDQELPRRRVAVKVLLTDALTDANRAAFVAEANLMAQLSAHPYIVSIHHADVSDDGRPYFIMEYCSGANLADRYKRQPLSVEEALRTGIRVSSAVATAHQAGILHRDIKPANILTNDYGWPALTDFGISSAVEDEVLTMTTTRGRVSDSGSTTGSQSVGMSIPWSPPEMFDDDPRPDVRSDVFSLAATVYTLLAGRTPFEIVGRGNQSLDLISRIERGQITPMDRTDVPPALLAVLRRGMSVERERRYPTAVEFARALQGVELQLSYAPTQIDVPNLVVPEPELPRDESSADATRARGVTSIAAQPPRAVVPPAAFAPAAGEETRLRPARTPAQPTPPASAAPAAALESTVLRPSPLPVSTPVPARRPRRVAPIVISIVVGLVVVAAIVVGVVVGTSGGPGASAGPTGQAPAGSDDDDAIVGSTIPTPELISATRAPDGTSLVVTWSNPDPADGDGYVWERTDGDSDGQRIPTSEPTATVDGVTAGTTVCLDVYVQRDGQLSPDPLKVCDP